MTVISYRKLSTKWSVSGWHLLYPLPIPMPLWVETAPAAEATVCEFCDTQLGYASIEGTPSFDSGTPAFSPASRATSQNRS